MSNRVVIKGEDICDYWGNPALEAIEEVLILDTVKQIPGVFARCANLRIVNIGHGVRGISFRAFEECTSLSEIQIPGTVETIEKQTFKGCTNLRSVKIGEGVKEIDEYAFWDCPSLREIHIPSSVQKIHMYAFVGCQNLSAIRVEPGNKHFSDKDGVLYDVSGKVVFYCPEGYSGNYSIPEGTLALHPRAFNNCNHLSSISIPASLKYWVAIFGSHEFFDADNMESYIVKDLNIRKDPDGYDLGGWLDYVFYTPFKYPYCIIFPYDRDYAICALDPLFIGCSALEAINVAPNNPYMKSDNGVLYRGCTLDTYPAAKKGSSYTLPAFVEKFNCNVLGVLSGCQYLTDLIIPMNVHPDLGSLDTLNSRDYCIYIRSITCDETWNTPEFERFLAQFNIQVHYYENPEFRLQKRKENLRKTLRKTLRRSLIALGVIAVIGFVAFWLISMGMAEAISTLLVIIAAVIIIVTLVTVL